MNFTSQEIAENYPLSKVDANRYAHRTISSRAFYSIVSTRLKARASLSVVRMGDGERQLFIEAATASANRVDGNHVSAFDPAWRRRMGIEGMTYHQLAGLMQKSIDHCEYFSPNSNGLVNPGYSVYPWFKLSPTTVKNPDRPLVDNFFVNEWTLDQRTALLKEANEVLVLHANPVTANTFARRARSYLNVGIRHISLSNWDQAEDAVTKCGQWAYPLALVSAGPGSKWVIPALAAQGKVVIDLGNAMDHWLLSELDPNVKKAG